RRAGREDAAARRAPRPALAVDEQPVERAEERPRAARDVRQLGEAVRRPALAPAQPGLLLRVGEPDLVEERRRIAGGVPLEMLRPEPQARRARELRVAHG